MTPPRILLAAVTVAIGGAVVTGCGPTVTDLPIPGGGVGGANYHLTAEFTDALNLPLDAKVKLDGVDIGVVDSMEAVGFQARVRLAILDSYRLPVGTTLTLRQATPLGEMYVAVTPPPRPGTTMLSDGSTVTPALTHQAATVEDTLAALSTVTNGGGISQLTTIVREANLALSGHGVGIHQLLNQLRIVLGTLHARSASIRQLITSAADLSGLVRSNDTTITRALDTFAPATRLLADQTQQLVTLSGAVDRLARAGSTLIARSKGDVLRVIGSLAPALNGYIAIDRDLAPTLNEFLTFNTSVQGIFPSEAGVGSLEVQGLVPDATPGGIPGVAGTPLPGLPQLPGPLLSSGLGGLVSQLPTLPKLGSAGTSGGTSGSTPHNPVGSLLSGLLGGGGAQ